MRIEVERVTKAFGAHRALDGVSLRVESGELIALLGPSGSGKTTLLRIIGGLTEPDEGRVLFEGEDMTDREVIDRKVGFVFQHYALFRRMTVFDNIAFGLNVRPRRARPSREAIRGKVEELLRLVQLEGLAGRYPHELSGGQRQRVALARALAVEPRVLLLDEPFGALDAKVRRELRRWLRKLHDDVHITSVFVTHDQEEALEVADRVVLLNEGRVEQVGTPTEVYEEPANKFVYNFLGSVNSFASGAAGAGAVYVRPHDIELSREGGEGRSLRVRVEHISPAGPVVRFYLQLGGEGELVEAELSRERFLELAPKVGEELYLVLKKARTFAEDAAG